MPGCGHEAENRSRLSSNNRRNIDSSHLLLIAFRAATRARAQDAGFAGASFARRRVSKPDMAEIICREVPVFLPSS